METNWNNEIRRRLRGCPRHLRGALKSERMALVSLYHRGCQPQKIVAIHNACKSFDAALRRVGHELNPSGPLC